MSQFQERMRQEGEKHLVDDDDRELSLQAWKDVQAYQEQMREERRRSLAQRLVDARKQKEAELTMHRGAVDRLHEELEHRRNEWLDVQAYKVLVEQIFTQSIHYDDYLERSSFEESLKYRPSSRQLATDEIAR